MIDYKSYQYKIRLTATNLAEQVKGVDPSEVRESVKGMEERSLGCPSRRHVEGEKGMCKGVK